MANWKRGWYITPLGYRMIKSHGHPRAGRDNYVFEHIIVFESYHKCCVLKWSDVHHLNNDRLDNRPENLSCMIKGRHSRLTRMEEIEKYGVSNFLRVRNYQITGCLTG